MPDAIKAPGRLSAILVPDEAENMGPAELERLARLRFFEALAGIIAICLLLFAGTRALGRQWVPMAVNLAMLAVLGVCWAWARRTADASRPMTVVGCTLALMLAWRTLMQGDQVPAAGWWLSVLPFVFAGGGFYRLAAASAALFLGVIALLFYGPDPASLGVPRDEHMSHGTRFASIVLSDLVAALVLAAVVQRRVIGAAALRAARDQAVAAAAVKARFIASVSHEIRTPLNGVIGAAELMRSGKTTEAQREQLLALQQQSAATLLTLVNDVLDFAKLEAGKVDLEVQPVSLRKMLTETNDLFAIGAFGKGVELTASCDRAVPMTCLGDPTRIRQIVNNLVGNAVKFTQSGDVHIRVGMSGPAPADLRDPCAIVIEVTDTGTGIAPQHIDGLFTAFTQADSSVTRRYGGTGLGLAISRELAEVMGGRISVSSTLGRGSTFSLHLPMRQVAEADRPPLAEPHHVVAVASGSSGFSAHIRWLLDELGVEPMMFSRLPRPDELAACRLLIVDAPALAGCGSVPDWLGARQRSGMRVAVAAAIGHESDVEFPAGVLSLFKPLRRSAIREALESAELPVAPARQTDVAPIDTPGIETRHILVVDDNSVNQLVVQAMLESLGVSFAAATNAEDALRVLEHESFDMVLMDVQMPEVDGLEVTRLWRRREAVLGRSRLPIVAMTAHSEGEEKKACIGAGMDGFLGKPFGIAQLRACIERSSRRSSRVADSVRAGSLMQ